MSPASVGWQGRRHRVRALLPRPTLWGSAYITVQRSQYSCSGGCHAADRSGSGRWRGVAARRRGASAGARAGELLIEVDYAGVNRPDLLQRSGQYPPPPDASPVLGLEVAGHIAAWGAAVGGWQVGEPVCALTPGGGYAELLQGAGGPGLPMPAGL